MAERDTSKAKTIRDWVNRPPTAPTTELLEKRQRLRDVLTAFIHNNGGWVTSAPGAKDLRLEIRQGSSLPAKLAEFGYNPRHCGTSTCITAGIIPVDIIEIRLGLL